MKAHEGVEDEQTGGIPCNRVAQPGLVVRAIETQDGRRDQVQGQRGEVESAMTADSTKARLDDGRCILGHVEEDAARVLHLEGSKTRRTAGDSEGYLERKPRFTGLRRAAKNSNARACPQRCHQPPRPNLVGVHVRGSNHGQGVVGHGEPPSSAIAASMACSSRKGWFLSRATRSATRRIFDATRSTPLLAR